MSNERLQWALTGELGRVRGSAKFKGFSIAVEDRGKRTYVPVVLFTSSGPAVDSWAEGDIVKVGGRISSEKPEGAKYYGALLVVTQGELVEKRNKPPSERPSAAASYGQESDDIPF